MPSWLLILIGGVGLAFLGYAGIGYAVTPFVTHTSLLAVPLFIFEMIGFSMAAFFLGHYRYWILLVMMLAGTIIAAIFDPFVWQMLGRPVLDASWFSVRINGILALVTVVFYLLGSITRRRFDRKIVKQQGGVS